MPWKRICCAVDFSPESRLAMVEAAELASRFGGTLTLLHVNDLPAQEAATDMLAPSETLALGKAELDRRFAAWKEEAEGIARTPVQVALCSGVPAVEIVRFARDGRHDAIVMGTRGETAHGHLRLGSVAETVTRESPCTVVVVRESPWAPAIVGRDRTADGFAVNVTVDCYAGYRGEETPRRIDLDGRQVEVVEVIDRWLGPDHRYFKVRGNDGAAYLLRHDEPTDRWQVQRLAPAS